VGTLSVRKSLAGDEAVRFQLYSAVRTEELGMQAWGSAEREQMLRLQYNAQRAGYRSQFPEASEWLIEFDDAPVGWMILDRSGAELRCIDIAIVSAHRGKGIGTLVLRELQKEAAESDRPLVLTVLRTNRAAVALYARLGFRVTGETDLYQSMEWRRE
jgi:ribosomal protein S18 acetylase RimI-like enzyme